MHTTGPTRDLHLPPRAFFAPTNKTHALHARVPGAPLLLLAPFLLLQRVGHGSGVSFLSEHHLASHLQLNVILILGTEEQTIHGVNSHPRRRSQCDTRWTRVRLRYKSFFPSILDVGPSSHTDRFVQPSPPLDSDMYGGRVPPTIVCLIAHLEQAGLDTPKLFGSDVRTLPRAT